MTDTTMPRTAAEGWNAGVLAMIGIASKSTVDINRTSKRHVHEDFAVAALSELAEAGRALLLPISDAPAPQLGAAAAP